MSFWSLHVLNKEAWSDIQGSDEVQGRLPQNVPLWHVDYFELKTNKFQQTQEELFTSPWAALKKTNKKSKPRFGTCTRMRDVTEKTFYKHWLVPPPCELSPNPFEVLDPWPILLSSAWHLGLNYLTVWEPHLFGLPPIYMKLNLFLSSVNLLAI